GTQWQKAGRNAGGAADHVRAGDQSQDREGARGHDPAVDQSSRRQGYRVNKRQFLMLALCGFRSRRWERVSHAHVLSYGMLGARLTLKQRGVEPRTGAAPWLAFARR